jgi:hypothetical protein
VQADGEDVGGQAPWDHRTVYPTVGMPFERFQQLFQNLPWEYEGRLK